MRTDMIKKERTREVANSTGSTDRKWGELWQLMSELFDRESDREREREGEVNRGEVNG